MLVLSVRKGETVEINFNGVKCRVLVQDADRGSVKLCFDAPKEVAIIRQNAKKREVK